MKTTITIIGFLISVTTAAQDRADSVLFSLVNNYRESLHIKPLLWDTSIYKGARHHSEYLTQYPYVFHQEEDGRFTTDTISFHCELVDVGMEILKTLEDRFRRYGVSRSGLGESENVCMFMGNFTAWPDSVMAEKLFNSWLHSEGHRQNMIAVSSKYAACSIVVKQIAITNIYADGHKRMIKVWSIIATFDLWYGG